MADRDSTGRFIPKKQPLLTPKPASPFTHRSGTTNPDRKAVGVALIIILLMGMMLILGMLLGSEFSNNNQSAAINQSARSYNQDQILSSEKELVNQIIDYEIKYGTRSVTWGVNVQFQE